MKNKEKECDHEFVFDKEAQEEVRFLYHNVVGFGFYKWIVRSCGYYVKCKKCGYKDYISEDEIQRVAALEQDYSDYIVPSVRKVLNFSGKPCENCENHSCRSFCKEEQKINACKTYREWKCKKWKN